MALAELLHRASSPGRHFYPNARLRRGALARQRRVTAHSRGNANLNATRDIDPNPPDAAAWAQALHHLRQRGKRLLFVTNNSSKSRQTYVSKFRALGIDAAPDEVGPAGALPAQSVCEPIVDLPVAARLPACFPG